MVPGDAGRTGRNAIQCGLRACARRQGSEGNSRGAGSEKAVDETTVTFSPRLERSTGQARIFPRLKSTRATFIPVTGATDDMNNRQHDRHLNKNADHSCKRRT